MNILRFAVEVFVIYLLYKLIFDFIIPVYRTSKRVKKQFMEMQSKMDEQMQQNNRYNGANSRQPGYETVHPQKKKEEYIDYEEIKD